MPSQLPRLGGEAFGASSPNAGWCLHANRPSMTRIQTKAKRKSNKKHQGSQGQTKSKPNDKTNGKPHEDQTKGKPKAKRKENEDQTEDGEPRKPGNQPGHGTGGGLAKHSKL